MHCSDEAKELGIPNHITQFDLFSDVQGNHNLKAKRFMDVFDKINEKYGRNTARLACEGFEKNGVLRSDLKSPAYATRWEELPNVIVR